MVSGCHWETEGSRFESGYWLYVSEAGGSDWAELRRNSSPSLAFMWVVNVRKISCESWMFVKQSPSGEKTSCGARIVSDDIMRKVGASFVGCWYGFWIGVGRGWGARFPCNREISEVPPRSIKFCKLTYVFIKNCIILRIRFHFTCGKADLSRIIANFFNHT